MTDSKTKTTAGTEIEIEIERSFATAVTPSARVLEIASMFGLGVDESRLLQVVPPTTLTLRGGEVVFITGPSGSGKSTILRLIGERVGSARCLDFARFLQEETGDDDTEGPVKGTGNGGGVGGGNGGGSGGENGGENGGGNGGESGGESWGGSGGVPIIERVGRNVEEATRVLSLAGLADAFVMLRDISQLSDGQRYRFALARVIDYVESKAGKKNDGGITDTEGLIVILADEFGAALDRLSAMVISRNIRKWVSGLAGVVFIAATTHDDLLEALRPDVLIHKQLGDGIEVLRRPVCGIDTGLVEGGVR